RFIHTNTQRERYTHTHRQTDTHTHIHTQRETDTHTLTFLHPQLEVDLSHHGMQTFALHLTPYTHTTLICTHIRMCTYKHTHTHTQRYSLSPSLSPSLSVSLR